MTTGARGAVIVGKDGVEKQLPLDQARKLSVFEREKITLSIGDRVRFTKNVKHRRHKFLNGPSPPKKQQQEIAYER